MGKKRKSSKQKGSAAKNVNFQSNSLMPARAPGEKPDMAFQIKTNATEIKNEIISEDQISTGLHDILTNNSQIQDFQSDCSNTSTATELMDQNIGNSSHSQDFPETQAVPTSFRDFCVKQETIDHSKNTSNQMKGFAPFMNNLSSSHVAQESSVQENGLQNDSENSMVNPQLINSSMKSEPVKNEETSSQSVIVEDDSNTSFPIKPKSVESAESENNQEATTNVQKRKVYFADNLEKIRKRLKTEPMDAINVSNANQAHVQSNSIPEENCDDEVQHTLDNLREIRKRLKMEHVDENQTVVLSTGIQEKNHDEDIMILPVAKVDVPVINISDEEDEESESLDTKTNQNSSSTKTSEYENFSKDILKYFSVASEIDRYDCKSALNYALTCNMKKTTLDELFPIIKKENNKPREIKVGDILFKTSKVENNLNPSASSRISNRQVCQATNRTATKCINLPGPSTSPSQLQTPPPPSAPIHVNPSQSLQPAAPPSTSDAGKSGLPLTFEQVEDALKIIMAANENNSVNASEFYLQPAQDPRFQKRHSTFDMHPLVPTQPTVQPVSNYINLPGSLIPQSFPLQSPSVLATASFNVNLTENPQPIEKLLQQNNHGFQRIELSNSLLTSVPAPVPPVHDPRLAQGKVEEFAPKKGQSISKYANLTGSLTPQSTAFPLQSPTVVATPSFSINLTGNPQRILGNTSPVPASMPPVRDPRLAQDKIEEFAPKRGQNIQNLHIMNKNEDIIEKLKTHMLQWNPSWLKTQTKTGNCPPICKSYPTVKHFYEDEMSYCNTYLPLHLLNIWFHVFNQLSTHSRVVDVECTVQSIERKDNLITYSCFSEMSHKWLRSREIVLCKHKDEEAFLFISKVMVRKSTSIETKKKIRIFLDSFHPPELNLSSGDILKFTIVPNVCTTLMQAEALNRLPNGLRDLILMPQSSKDLKIIVIEGNKGKLNPKKIRDEILDAAVINSELKNNRNVPVVVVATEELRLSETYQFDNNVQILITMMTYAMIFSEKFKERHVKVLILVSDIQMLFHLQNRLKEYKTILAVKIEQFKLTQEQSEATLESKLNEKDATNDKELRQILTNILNEHNIFISTFSAFGEKEKSVLSKHNKWNCIVYDARKVTEPETTVPMQLRLNKLFLLGNRKNTVNLPNILRNHNYHCTLFDRLLSSKMQQ